MSKEEQEYDVITLTFEDNSTEDCLVLAVFGIDKQDYTALMPVKYAESDSEDGEVYLYRYSEDTNGEPILGDIKDEEEYEMVADAFDEILDEAEFNAE